MRLLFRYLNEPEPSPPWGLLTALLTLFTAFGFMISGSIIGQLVFPSDFAAAAMSGWLLGSTFLIAVIRITRRTADDLNALRLGASAVPALILLGLGFGFAVTFDLIGFLFRYPAVPPPELVGITSETALFSWILAGLLLILVQPVADELLFRGLLYPALRAVQGVWASIVVSGAFYGLFHQLIYPDVSVWASLVEPLLMGFVLGLIRAGTRSTRAVVFVHIGFGVFGLLKAILIIGVVG